MKAHIFAFVTLAVMVACSGDDMDAIDFGPSTAADDPTCAEQYSVCGDLLIPGDFAGTPRSLVLALYNSVPPAGPPIATIAEVEAPAMQAGTRYPIRQLPVLETGEYFLWANLYMEGGGMRIPKNDIDLTGSSAAKIALDGSPLLFDDILLEPASGW